MARVNEGRLVRIRPIREADLDVINAWRLESDALGGFNEPLIRSIEVDRAHWQESGFITPGYAMFAIETIEDERLVGKVGFSKDSSAYDHMARTISLIAAPADRGKGYATEARMLLVNQLFLSTNLERIYSETDEHNTPARRSLEKCGMTFEGVLRHLVFDVGRWSDMAVYAILRAEWQASPHYAPYRDAFQQPWTSTEAG